MPAHEVTIELEADAEGYRYALSCYSKGIKVTKREYEEDIKNTINAKYLLGLNAALERMVKPSKILIRVKKNGKYIYGVIHNNWVKEWQKNGWMSAKKNGIRNKTLWQQYVNLAQKHELQIRIEGNNGET